MEDIQANYPRILVKRLEAMGDILMATPIIRKLYNDRSGKCFIDFQLHEPHKDVILLNPFVRYVIGIHEPLPDTYDMIINLDLVYEKKPTKHVIDAYAEMVFGNTKLDKSMDLFTDSMNTHQADHLYSQINNDFIVLHIRNYPGTSRNISLDFWNKLIIEVIGQTDLSIVFIGKGNDICFTGNDRFIDARNQYSIKTVKEIIARAKIFVGSDTGTLHIAGTTNTDIIGLFTSVRPQYRFPVRLQGKFIGIAANIDCHGCQEQFAPPVVKIDCMRGDYECQNRFDPIQVSKFIKDLSIKQ